MAASLWRTCVLALRRCDNRHHLLQYQHGAWEVVDERFQIVVRINGISKVVVWVAAPAMIRAGSTTAVMTVLLVAFLLEYLPKIYHSVSFLRRTQDQSGHIFGTIWWGIVLNLMAYFVAAHAVGACWYLLGVQRATKCLKEQCSISGPPGCASGPLACPAPLYYQERVPRQRRQVPVRRLQVDGVPERDHVQEAGHAHAAAEPGVVDEAQGAAAELPAPGAAARGWAATRGVDECQIVRDLPEALRRDIKYHLCLDLVRQVPLFQHMDDLVLENMCDRVRSLIYPKGETIVREGDPVQRMVFIVRGHLECRQELRNGATSCCMLGPGNFTGDELLSWCLRRVGRLPASSATLVTLESTEVFGLEAADVKYVTQHFRYTFTNERVRRSARYYSPGWRTWAAVAVQLAWRRYKHRKTLESLSFIRPRRPLSRCSSLGEEKLRLYTAILASPKPNQDDDFSF
uniref:Uncharacterized protein n=1 Tax=Aegilops tauschii TaxID=37682 RepID=M8BSP3_AEGTA